METHHPKPVGPLKKMTSSYPKHGDSSWTHAYYRHGHDISKKGICEQEHLMLDIGFRCFSRQGRLLRQTTPRTKSDQHS